MTFNLNSRHLDGDNLRVELGELGGSKDERKCEIGSVSVDIIKRDTVSRPQRLLTVSTSTSLSAASNPATSLGGRRHSVGYKPQGKS